MKIKGLDNKYYNINLSLYLNKERSAVSSYHEQARQLLKKLYPLDVILEEIDLPGCHTRLYLDFLLPHRRFGVEVQGEQHYRFSEFYHKDKEGYRKSQLRDIEKVRWCDLNSIILVELSYKENVDEWTNKLLHR